MAEQASIVKTALFLFVRNRISTYPLVYFACHVGAAMAACCAPGAHTLVGVLIRRYEKKERRDNNDFRKMGETIVGIEQMEQEKPG